MKVELPLDLEGWAGFPCARGEHGVFARPEEAVKPRWENETHPKVL